MKMHMKEHHPDSTLCTNFVKNGRISKRTVLLCPADECSFYSAMFSSLQEHMSCHQESFLQNFTTTESETAARMPTQTAPPDGDSSVHQSKKKQKPRTELQPGLEYTCVICVIERKTTLIFKNPEDLRRHTVEAHPPKLQNCFSWDPLNSDKERKG
ncbi:uncharacterized protein LOC106175038 [Lingula anatina]|uniref:Uncharacterized protein LOC106175038 n=1 Tax=Lingula anatina TaxID=7574 RepID=A0A1S3JQ70_LINAN|nr:uncharacterized protein LOC106175038 [Lingula anatina]|eukprot:XP_013412301.2 uncharacterized protein LOC106175038 [Lingula anatina]